MSRKILFFLEDTLFFSTSANGDTCCVFPVSAALEMQCPTDSFLVVLWHHLGYHAFLAAALLLQDTLSKKCSWEVGPSKRME